MKRAISSGAKDTATGLAIFSGIILTGAVVLKTGKWGFGKVMGAFNKKD